MADESDVRKVVLWGATSVGKTTALAAYVCRYKPKWIDERDDADLGTRDTRRQLQRMWTTLRSNQLVGGTSTAVEYSLRHRRGWRVDFRDMRGRDSHDAKTSEHAEALRKAAAALVFIEMDRIGLASNINAVDHALAELASVPAAALVITKCESQLTKEEFGRFVLDPHEFAADRPELRALRQVMDRFPQEAVFPVTVYGWHNGLPAQYLDGFGRFVPFHIEPCMVDRPFDYAMELLQSAEPT